MPLPARLGKYEIRREIGRGAMGTVYEGFDPLIHRAVAIKAVRLDRTSPEQAAETLTRARREAQAAGRLNHPGVVAVYEYGEEPEADGTRAPFIAMELVDGRDLKSLLEAGRDFTPDEAAALMTQILAALEHAHVRGVTHRDIKPANVMLMADGSIKLTDFGIAHLEGSDLTSTGAMLGTPQYMAPEQLLGQPIDGRADLFACGAILYELLAGRKAFSGGYATVVQKVLNANPEPASQFNPRLPAAWDELLRTALAKAPAARFQTAAAFAAAIARLPQPLPVPDDDATVILPPPGSRTTEPVRLTSATMEPTAPLATATAAAGRRRRNAGLGLALLVLLAAGAAYWLWPRPAAPPPSSAAPPATEQLAQQVPMPRAEPQPPASPVPPSVSPRPAAPAPASAARPPALPPKPATPPVPAPAPIPAPATVTTPPQMPVQMPVQTPAQTRPPPPARPPAVDDWALRRAAVVAAAPRNLADALATLLDIRSREERRLLTELDTLLQPPPVVALALGVAQGRIGWQWSTAAGNDPAAAVARRACSRAGLADCAVVVANGRFQDKAFGRWMDALAARHVAEVRTGFVRELAAGLPELRQRKADAVAAASTRPAVAASAALDPEPAPAASVARPMPPPAPAPAARPPARWVDEPLQALRRDDTSLTLSAALRVLLDVRSADDLATLERFEAGMKRLPWRSAFAMGERNGYVGYAYARQQQRDDWAAESAAQYCSRHANECRAVMLNGSFDAAAFIAVAARLGAVPQATLRAHLLSSIRRSVDRGL